MKETNILDLISYLLINIFFSDQFQLVQELRRNVQEALAKVGVIPNAKKTKYTSFDHQVDVGLKTLDKEVIEL